VFVDARNDMQIAQDEMFGPIVPIIKVNDEAEALRVANDTQYWLSSAVFTRTGSGASGLCCKFRLA